MLIPDFKGSPAALHTVLDARPDVLNHNIETVPRVFRTVRPGGRYERSLDLLDRARRYVPDIPTKSGLMVGLGEQWNEVVATLGDLRWAGVSILTVGQYLRPSQANLPTVRYYHPDEFAELRRIALELGFLMRAMFRAGFASRPTSRRPDDGLRLIDAYIAAAVRCAPPDNRPTTEELANCHAHLVDELAALRRVGVIVALGRIAFAVCWKLAADRGVRPRPGLQIRRDASGRRLVSPEPAEHADRQAHAAHAGAGVPPGAALRGSRSVLVLSPSTHRPCRHANRDRAH